MAQSQSKIPVTVVVPIKNEALNLPQCLDKLQEFEEVVVVDSGSTDDSPTIVRRYGAVFLDFQWNGQFPKKRNWTLRNYQFRTEWVLFLDADEQLTPEFIAELKEAIKQTGINGYWVTFRNYFMGHPLKYGDPFRKLVLLRLGCGEFERIEDNQWSALDMEVHEHLILKGRVGQMKAPIEHRDFKNLDAYYNRHNHYSSWEAARFLALKEEDRRHFTKRQQLKYRLLTSIWFPPLYFLGSYVLKRGFLDGTPGFRFAIGKMFYFYQINFKIAEKSGQ